MEADISGSREGAGPRRSHMIVGDCIKSEPGNMITGHDWAQETITSRSYPAKVRSSAIRSLAAGARRLLRSN